MDGDEHRSPSNRMYDIWRDEQFCQMGYRVARVTNKAIDIRGDNAVLDAISGAISTPDISSTSYREDKFRAHRIYTAVVEAMSMVLQGHIDDIQMSVKYTDRDGNKVEFRFGSTLPREQPTS